MPHKCDESFQFKLSLQNLTAVDPETLWSKLVLRYQYTEPKSHYTNAEIKK